MTKRKFAIVYIGRSNNIHDKRFVEALSGIFEVQEIYTQDIKATPLQAGIFSNIALIVAGPLTDAISAIPLEVKVPILGISHAFDLNIEFSAFPTLANINRCTAIMSDCRHVTNMLRNIYDYKGKVYEVPWGCDQDYFSKVKIEFENKPKILVTRNWFANYRNDIIISALELLESRKINFECTFIGSGPLLENQIKNLGPLPESSNIRFLGHQGSLKIRDAMSENWIYISAASSDGTSISLLEAMAAGMICIVTDFPSNLEWIENSISGFIFPNGDIEALALMIELVSSLSLKEKMKISRAAREIIHKRGDWKENQKIFTSAASAMA